MTNRVSTFNDSSVLAQESSPNKRIKEKEHVCEPALHAIVIANQPYSMTAFDVSQGRVQQKPKPFLHPLCETFLHENIIIQVEGQKVCSTTLPSNIKEDFKQLNNETRSLRNSDYIIVGSDFEEWNRYENVLGTDHWLFRLNDPDWLHSFEDWKNQILKWNGVGDCPYINASCIGHFDGDIITQGPLMNTCADFWRMAWYANSSLIMMLTPWSEGGKTKCAQYFPKDSGETLSFGEDFIISVKLLDSTEKQSVVTRKFLLKHGKEERILSHIHCTNWSDQTTYPTENMRQLVHSAAHLSSEHSLITHCSAGIGRSGTFYACYLIYVLWKDNNYSMHVNVRELVKFLRLFRPGLIQNAAQYEAIFDFANSLTDQS